MNFTIPGVIFLITVLAIYISLGKLFVKAGRKEWEGWVPFYNLYVWQKITNRSWWWILILIIPGVNFLMLIIMNVQMAWSFGQRGTKETLMSIIIPFIQFPKMAFSKDVQYTGNINWRERKKSTSREWGDAILFAIIAAFIIRTFMLEAFTIPTPSMEASMLVGDYLFVSKASYGAKVPVTPISFPLAHHTLPFFNTKSYLEWQKLDYHRLPGWTEVENLDPVVFNFPEGDTILFNVQNQSYYQLVRDYGRTKLMNPKFRINAGNESIPVGEMIVRPVDKKENYVKRCTGTSGQTLEIKNQKIYINGELQVEPEGIQQNYIIETKSEFNPRKMKKELDIDMEDRKLLMHNNIHFYILPLTASRLEVLKSYENVSDVYDMMQIDDSHLPTDFNGRNVKTLIKQQYTSSTRTFPNNVEFQINHPWTIDNYGPILIPARGLKIELNKDNLPLYKRAIGVYEKNSIEQKGDDIYINGEKTNTYTFELNYYWMMGDNRHNSQDSRFWGFVPEDHIVGKPLFVWLSLDKSLGWFDGKIRWKRMFRGVD